MLDEQHKKVMELLNRLLDAAKHGLKAGYCGTIFDELISYAASHFTAEEDAMKKHNYPYFKRHHEEHSEIKMKISEMYQKCVEGNMPRTVEILQFITLWMDKHLKNTDVSYGAFLVAKGFK